MQGETVVRLRAKTKNSRYSNQAGTQLDWTQPPAEKPMATLAPAQPIASTESTEVARDAVTSGYRLYLAECEDFTALDRVRVRGEVHQVHGRPETRHGFALVVETRKVDG